MATTRLPVSRQVDAVERAGGLLPDPDSSCGADGAVPDFSSVPAQEAWEYIVRVHRQRLYRLALALTRNPHDAEDLTHEVLHRVFRKLDQYRTGNFYGWLYRVTVNVHRDQARRRRRVCLQRLEAEVADRTNTFCPGPEEIVLGAMVDGDVEIALRSLSPVLRDAMLMYDVVGLSYDEIAEILDIKRGTVASRIHRARARMRVVLAHRAPVSTKDRARASASVAGAA
jgi:RNA polymerase sigma factor (sigma-70 family)